MRRYCGVQVQRPHQAGVQPWRSGTARCGPKATSRGTTLPYPPCRQEASFLSYSIFQIGLCRRYCIIYLNTYINTILYYRYAALQTTMEPHRQVEQPGGSQTSRKRSIKLTTRIFLVYFADFLLATFKDFFLQYSQTVEYNCLSLCKITRRYLLCSA